VCNETPFFVESVSKKWQLATRHGYRQNLKAGLYILLDVTALFLSNPLDNYIISVFGHFTAQPHLLESAMGRGSPKVTAYRASAG
jgi:hypothetical protein